ncbi:hypothetical protein JCM1393_18380 [Clostridium carnis]
MKNKLCIKTVIITTIISIAFSINLKTKAFSDFSNNIQINTEKYYLEEVHYENFNIKAKRIKTDESNSLGYCLEIDKSYPHGEKFSKMDTVAKGIENIILSGYPNKSPKELGVDSEEQAYFATQIAIWSLMEGYNVNKFRGNNPKIITAIKNIYNEGMLEKHESNKYKYYLYYANDNVQQVVVAVEDTESQGVKSIQDIKKEENIVLPDNIIIGK